MVSPRNVQDVTWLSKICIMRYSNVQPGKFNVKSSSPTLQTLMTFGPPFHSSTALKNTCAPPKRVFLHHGPDGILYLLVLPRMCYQRWILFLLQFLILYKF